MNSITKTLLIALIFIGSTLQAQSRRERIKTQKVAYITDQLQLTSDEAAKFWPIYNEFEENSQQLKRRDMRQLRRDFENQGGDTISNADANKLLNRFIAIEEALYKKKVQLIEDLRKVISAKKIIKLRRVEDEFNRQLLKRFREGGRNKN